MKRKTILYLLVAVWVMMLASCKKDPPTLALSPNNITFTGKGDSRTLYIETDADATWTFIGEVPSWLATSARSGKGASSITLTTKEDNLTGTDYATQIVIESTNSHGGVQETLNLTYISSVPQNCIASIKLDNMLKMSHGAACPVECGNNTAYFYYVAMSEDKWNDMKGEPDRIEADCKASGSKWKRKTITSEGGAEIVVSDCDAKHKYVLVAIPYTTDGTRGIISDCTFETKLSSEQPRVDIEAYSEFAQTDGEGNTGKFYKWSQEKNSFTTSFYTYVCGFSEKTGTIAGRADFREYHENNGINTAWEIKKLLDKGDAYGEGFIINKNCTHEKLFRPQFDSSDAYFEVNDNDKYIQILTWAKSGDEFSGIVYDMVYEIKNGRIDTGSQTTYTFEVSPGLLSFGYDGGQQTITLSGNDSWTATSNSAWCSITPQQGTAPGSATVVVQANESTSSRSAVVTITGQNTNKSFTLNVSQPGKPDTPSGETGGDFGRDDYDGDIDLTGGGTQYTLSASTSTSLSVSSASGQTSVSLSGNDSWTASSDAAWCTLPSSSGTAPSTMYINYQANTATSSRIAHVTIRGINSNTTINVTITQQGSVPIPPQPSVTQIDFSKEGGMRTIDVTGTDSWTVTSANTVWCTVSPSSGTGGSFVVTAKANNGSARSTTVTLRGQNTGSSVVIRVNQVAGADNDLGRDDYESDIQL